MDAWKRFAIVLGLAALAAACSTPRAALDQANNGAALIAQLEQEMREFRRVEEAIARNRRQSILDQEIAIETVAQHTSLSMRARRAAGDFETERLYDLIRELADATAEDDSRTKAAIADVEGRLEALLKPLPFSSEKSSEAQKALLILGSELPLRDRLTELRNFVKTVKEGVDSNKEKIAEAANSLGLSKE
jgi:hypothetical protein